MSNWHTTLLASLHAAAQVVLIIFSLLVESILFMIDNYLYCLYLLPILECIYLPKNPINSSIQYTLIIDAIMFSHRLSFSFWGIDISNIRSIKFPL